MDIKTLHKELHAWSTKNKNELGYYQEFELVWSINQDKDGYIYSVEIREAEERHVLAGANGRTVDKAIDQLVMRLPSALESWGWPSEFPVSS